LRPPERVPGIGVLSLGEKVRMESAQAALLSPTAFPQERFLGYLDRINPTVDEARGMVVAVVRVIQPASVEVAVHGNLLNQFDRESRQAVLKTSEAARNGKNLAMRPGMWVNALIATEFIENALLIPGAAIVGDEELVWVVTPDKDNPETGVARPVDISARRGVSSEGSVELKPRQRRGGKAGGDEAAPKREMPDVSDGSLIVVRGQTLLRDGQRVRIKDISK
jgi:multidrug efflux pump subunit AcrA (membrane-fusion protein)